MSDDVELMREAISLAEEAARVGEVPIGCVVVDIGAAGSVDSCERAGCVASSLLGTCPRGLVRWVISVES